MSVSCGGVVLIAGYNSEWAVGVECIHVEGTLQEGLQELLPLCCCGCSQREGPCIERKASRALSEGTSSSQRGVAIETVVLQQRESQ